MVNVPWSLGKKTDPFNLSSVAKYSFIHFPQYLLSVINYCETVQIKFDDTHFPNLATSKQKNGTDLKRWEHKVLYFTSNYVQNLAALNHVLMAWLDKIFLQVYNKMCLRIFAKDN